MTRVRFLRGMAMILSNIRDNRPGCSRRKKTRPRFASPKSIGILLISSGVESIPGVEIKFRKNQRLEEKRDAGSGVTRTARTKKDGGIIKGGVRRTASSRG